MTEGIDVSKWQGSIDWQKVKDSGIGFAILRAGYGQGVIDPWFAKNAAACNRIGLPIGAYWFSYAKNKAEAVKEAEFCLAAVAPYRLQYPICFDFEYGSVSYAGRCGVSVNRDLATDIADAFLNRIEEGGYYACNYMNYDYSQNMFDMNRLARYDVWYARYRNRPDRDDCGLWQYTSSGRVPGIRGNVDRNCALRDYPSIMAKNNLNRLDAVQTFKKGDKVRVVRAVQYGNGRPFKAYYDRYDVLEVRGNRVVIGIGIVVTAAVSAENLKLA